MIIDNQTLGEGQPVYIIAELSGNHNHRIEWAKETIQMAKEAGANAVKLQTYTPDTITLDCDNEYFQITQGTIWDGTTLHKLYRTAYTPFEWHEELFDYGKKIGITIFSSPFDKTAVDLLESLGTSAYKIASFEINDIPLIQYIASKNKPIILSTGVATRQELEEALIACGHADRDDIALLKCTSAYPTPPEQVNLHTMADMRSAFHTLVGLSDHTLGTAVSIGAVALGATLIERHVILDKAMGGPDVAFSLDAKEFTALVSDIRQLEKAMGTVSYELSDMQTKSKEHSRSLFVVRDIKKGERITEENVRSIRPAFGMHPRHFEEILGKPVNRDLAKGTPMDWAYLDL